MNLALWLERAGKSNPDRPALGLGTRVLRGYGELAGRVARLAGTLTDTYGLRPGDRVAIAAKNSPDYLDLLYAIWHAGLAAVPANAKLHGAELGYILEQSGARLLPSTGLDGEIARHAPPSLERLITVGNREYEQLFAPTRSRRSRATVATSPGCSTRRAPPAGRRARCSPTVCSRSRARPTWPTSTRSRPATRILHAAPMSHGSGLYIMAHVARLAVNVVPESGAFEPGEIFDLFATWPRASMFAAPTMIKRLVECPADCRAENIRTLVWGGAPMYVEDALKALDRFGPRLAQIYGQGESPMTITTLSREDIAARDHPRWRERLASAGRPFACADVIVADADDRPLPVGEAGEILCRGDMVMPGYWRNAQASEQTLKDGWLHTGDVGVFDADGYLRLKDRSKDLIISGGSNIYPREVEEVLLRHAKVREVSVIGRPDREWGEVVIAYVVGEASAAELDALCLAHIARFKRPKDYVFVDGLPKNNYGKILKTELRERDAGRGS